MIGRWLAGAIGVMGFAATLEAQQTTIGGPANSVGAGFYEQIGVRWGLRGNGWFFNFGGPPPAPPFGGFDPNAGANFGVAGPRGFFNVTAGQGSSRSMSGAAPSVTVMNGASGFFSDTVQRPFVTGFVPVVGGPVAAGPSVLEERLHRLRTEGAPPDPDPKATSAAAAPPADSTAARGDLSVAEIKAQKIGELAAQQSKLQAEIDALLEKARGADEAGKPGLAKIYRQMAERRSAKP